ncbi:MAG TPA: diaminopimelate epimerase [Sulfurihydrogenibium sp.]|uniref:diaminopimelate epimerase n=1 Tax=Sulfurihydrogenibium sp. (strain YO3AOP1) TaxID=436114 RepID=UPI0001723664|nr:diaminopimelate epimerase [Sulfurihydrogenibium sp. YO3AOP1]ACD65816.1 Diaminopimelate epimerase [Sulfurihydrogenibium sp. YO3AOP1]HBT97921.1 diaminopimelate epimerase [Sulfurihydrogenibium sp.]
MEKNNFFVKSHGLGNDYIVLDSDKIDFKLTQGLIKKICDVHYGIGSDGILVKYDSDVADFKLRIFNPDGSEAEKSGNGLRIFCKFLYDYGYTDNEEFTVETKGGIVKAKIEEKNKFGKAKIITVDMGKAIFNAKQIPINTDKEEFISEKITVGDKEFEVNCVSVGNPHCVIIKENLDEEEIKKYGPMIENHPLFPNRINVQFVKPISRNEAQILIWERGAGFTYASGSSSCGVASVLVKKGLADREIKIKMIGGELKISIDEDWNIKMTGEVQEICSGYISREFLE